MDLYASAGCVGLLVLAGDAVFLGDRHGGVSLGGWVESCVSLVVVFLV